MPYISLQPFMNDRKEFERYTTFEDRGPLVYNIYLTYDEKMNQVVARMFRLEVLKEEEKKVNPDIKMQEVLKPLGKYGDITDTVDGGKNKLPNKEDIH